MDSERPVIDDVTAAIIEALELSVVESVVVLVEMLDSVLEGSDHPLRAAVSPLGFWGREAPLNTVLCCPSLDFGPVNRFEAVLQRLLGGLHLGATVSVDKLELAPDSNMGLELNKKRFSIIARD